MPKRSPLVFISHKHSDSLIADEVRKWIYKWGRREVEVFQSSAPDARGPEIARVLSAELNKALWAASAVILIYTDEEQDWSWCMFECGVATIPDSPDTRVVVFQCSADQPKVFQDKVRVDARNMEDVTKFVIAFLTEPSFFRDAEAAVAPGLRPEHIEIQTAATELYKALFDVLPTNPISEWPAQPLIRLQLSADTVKKVANGSLSAEEQRSTFDQAPIIGMYQHASQVFGIAELPAGANFGWLVNRWAGAHPGVPLKWADDVRRQVCEAATGGIPTLRWSYLREIAGDCRYAPVLTRVRDVPALKSMQFDVNLFPYDRLIATPVVERMVMRDDMKIVDLDKTPADQLLLLALTTRFDDHHLNRIPVLDGTGRPKLIVHRSMINLYLARQLAAGAVQKLQEATLAQLLAEEPEFKRLFETSFDVVSKDDRLTDARAKMASNADCYDVFVTQSGQREEPVLGWLTDVIIAQSLGLD